MLRTPFDETRVERLVLVKDDVPSLDVQFARDLICGSLRYLADGIASGKFAVPKWAWDLPASGTDRSGSFSMEFKFAHGAATVAAPDPHE